MIRRLLIANRGEIASRIARTCRRLGVDYVAVYSDADTDAPHLEGAIAAVRIGPAAAARSYLDGARIVSAALKHGCDAVHPGYGFLSENATFARDVEAAGLIFVGPDPETIAAMGDKERAKTIMSRAGVPVVPGSDRASDDPDEIVVMVDQVGRPALLKPVAGGGGKGMTIVDSMLEGNALRDAVTSSVRTARAAFADGRLLVERYLPSPRHVEVQVFGDGRGNVVHLFERECSLQRRHQKVVEEAPAAGLDTALREKMTAAAVQGAKTLRYRNAGTFEFILGSDGSFAFLEVNTRLQVEHPVTEEVTGIDLVEWQLRVASGEDLPLTQEAITCTGHAIECRIYAEDPVSAFRPSPGTVRRLSWPAGPRVESAVERGASIPPDYDPMLAKLIVAGADRAESLASMKEALAGVRVAGVATNIGFLSNLLSTPEVVGGEADTTFIDAHLDRILQRPSMAPVFAAAAAAVAARWRPVGEGRLSLWLGGGSDREALDSMAPQGRLWLSCGADYRVIRVITMNGATVTLEGCDDVTGESRHTIRLDGCDGSWRSGVADAAHFSALVGDSSVEVLLEGYRHLLDLMPTPEGSVATGGEIRSEMPATVVSVPVKSGDTVARGAPLVVLEAMKMEMPVLCPRDCVIAEVLCTTGSQVRAGQALLRLGEAIDAPGS
ncbi:carbamoyl-phosphate synthase subunit L [Aquicoccus sp. SCR17]|nr:carbamoyl-phosphate synthase subunit L [Carideicomes alvinocaridis]